MDYGSKRVGLAATDPLGITIQPLPYLRYSGRTDLLEKLRSVIREKGIEKVVVGLPRSLDGSLGPKARECEELARQIGKDSSVQVALQDESFTSREAEEILIRDLGLSRARRKEARDSLAACLILKSFLANP